MAEKTMQVLTPTINGYGYVEWLPIEGSPYEL